MSVLFWPIVFPVIGIVLTLLGLYNMFRRNNPSWLWGQWQTAKTLALINLVVNIVALCILLSLQ